MKTRPIDAIGDGRIVTHSQSAPEAPKPVPLPAPDLEHVDTPKEPPSGRRSRDG